jgi:1,4-dihydroxy-6-naphthoate synthase
LDQNFLPDNLTQNSGMTLAATRTPVSIAYSPDSDDAFMMEAIADGLAEKHQFAVEFFRDDIQKLNELATAARYDLTAISIAAFPKLAKDYWLVPTGASIGVGYGPALAALPNSESALLAAGGQRDAAVARLKGKRIAVPGAGTSAYLAALAVLPEFTPVFLSFLEIAPAIQSGAVDAGILIHELQLAPEQQGLYKMTDLGSLWQSKFRLPLPLGANAIRRSLGVVTANRLNAMLVESIGIGLGDRQATLSKATAKAVAPVSKELGDRYIEMYVNHHSLFWDREVITAVQLLFDTGASHGMYPRIDVKQHMIH